MNNKYKIRTITCANCGKLDTRRQPVGRKFCSLDCYRTALRPNRKTGQNRKCGNCGKYIYVKQSALKQINYCSVECFNQTQSRKDKYTCEVCGKVFLWSPSRKARKPKYCSQKCRNVCPVWKRNSVIKGNLVQQNNKGPNKLEIAGCSLLDAIGIDYKTQVLICEKFVVDVFVPSLNLIIQWDGDYWHGYGEVKDDRQRKRMRLDKSQDAYMRKVGYKVIRFWEYEVKQEADNVKKNIIKTVQQLASQTA